MVSMPVKEGNPLPVLWCSGSQTEMVSMPVKEGHPLPIWTNHTKIIASLFKHIDDGSFRDF